MPDLQLRAGNALLLPISDQKEPIDEERDEREIGQVRLCIGVRSLQKYVPGGVVVDLLFQQRPRIHSSN